MGGIPTVDGNIVDGLVAGEKAPESIDKIHQQLTTTIRTSLNYLDTVRWSNIEKSDIGLV